MWPANGYVMAPTRAFSALVVMKLTAMATSGCAAAGRPTVEEARAETEALLQQIANEVPGGVVTVVVDLLGLTPCGVGQPPAR